MSFSNILSAVLLGMEVRLVRVEADISNGLPMFHMVGYLSAEVKEAGERVRTAIRNSGFDFPAKKTVINLSPANIRKRGASFDLPIALAILTSLGMVDKSKLEKAMVIGELGLDGKVRRCTGILPIVAAAKKEGCHTCIVPYENAKEAAIIEKIQIIGVKSLSEICSYLNGNIFLNNFKLVDERLTKRQESDLDFCDIYGQEGAKRAAEIAVAGRHNLLLLGPPGSGKSMLAKRIPSILPPLTMEESIEITKVYSVAGLLKKESPLIVERPFREVHHTVTKAALIGGGSIPKPGEISLASGGVLFLDELAEFQKSVLEVLRQPLETREIQLVRSQGNFRFPADVMLVAAMNPCPCGYYPDFEKCRCTSYQIRQYLSKISQPFLGRMDICMEVPGLRYEQLQGDVPSESSADIRERIMKARDIQRARYVGKQFAFNAGLTSSEIESYCELDAESRRMMRQAFDRLELTARTYHKILKVARTIADLDRSERIKLVHLQEAIGYRMMDKKYWGRV